MLGPTEKAFQNYLYELGAARILSLTSTHTIEQNKKQLHTVVHTHTHTHLYLAKYMSGSKRRTEGTPDNRLFPNLVLFWFSELYSLSVLTRRTDNVVLLASGVVMKKWKLSALAPLHRCVFLYAMNGKKKHL